MTRPAILDRLRGVQRAGSGWLAFCPAHEDRHKRSLSVGVGADGRTLLNCHAQRCPAEKITAAVNMTLADLAPANTKPDGPRGDGAGRILATYDYTDGAGALLYQVVRFEPKRFVQRRPDGRDGWIWNLDGVQRVLYRLPELVEQPRVLWVEGERDVDRLAGLGITATTSPGGAQAFRGEYAEQLARLGAQEVVVLPDNDAPGRKYAEAVAGACRRHGMRTRILALPGLPEKGDVSDWLDAGHTREELEALAAMAPIFDDAPGTGGDPVAARDESAQAEPAMRREGFDLTLTWPNGVSFALAAIRDGRDGVRGELTVGHGTCRVSWGSLALASTAAREALRKKLEAAAPGLAWGEYLEHAAWQFTQAARQGEPLITLTGTMASPMRELLPGLLYEGEPTLEFGDGDTGKSLMALLVAMAVHSGAALPLGLKPARAVPAAYLDWETSADTVETRLALLAAGLGIDPPGLLYKRMTRPLVDEAPQLAAEFARRGVGLVVVDSMMFAVAGGDGAAFHEPIVGFWNALRLFTPAASLVVSHVTGADARSGAPGRPFGGAFAFNGPRLVWEAKRDQNVDDATAIILTCRKANNLARRPGPFGLRFQPGESTITIYPFDLAEAAPQTLAGAPLPQRVRVALAGCALTVAELAEHLSASEDTVGKVVRRLREKGHLVQVGDTRPRRWGLAGRP